MSDVHVNELQSIQQEEKLTTFSGEPMNPAFTRTARWLGLDRTTAAYKPFKCHWKHSEEQRLSAPTLDKGSPHLGQSRSGGCKGFGAGERLLHCHRRHVEVCYDGAASAVRRGYRCLLYPLVYQGQS